MSSSLLAKDMLINVTRFFRDPEVFDHLEDRLIPDLVRNQPQRSPAPHLDCWL